MVYTYANTYDRVSLLNFLLSLLPRFDRPMDTPLSLLIHSFCLSNHHGRNSEELGIFGCNTLVHNQITQNNCPNCNIPILDQIEYDFTNKNTFTKFT